MRTIEYVNRATGKIEQEAVAGEKWIKWLYFDKMGKVALELIFKHYLPSFFYGLLANSRFSRKWIHKFLDNFPVDRATLDKDPSEYKHFNDFFYRKQKSALPKLDDNIVALPAEGRHLVYPSVSENTYFDVKQRSLNIKGLLGDYYSDKLKDPSMVISRLCPLDYHRFHFPYIGKVTESKKLNGYLYSVNPYALKQNAQIFSENKREVTEVKLSDGRSYWIVDIGATFVGSIYQTFTTNSDIGTLDEKGYFAFGGSMLITIFENGTVAFDEDFVKNTEKGYETYAAIGDRLGQFIKKS